MQILLPIAGATPYFPPADFPFPKPLIEICGQPMISWVVESLHTFAADVRFAFIALADDAARCSYDNIFRLITGGRCDVYKLRKGTSGALCSCLMAIDSIDEDAPLLIANSDQIVDADLGEIRRRFEMLDADAGVVTFPSIHPRWSYVRIEGEHDVVEASEKRVISRHAIAGMYYFKRGADFIRAAQKSIKAGDGLEGVFYLAPSLNHLILEGLKVVAVEIDESRYHSFYLPSRIEAFERSLAANPAPAPADAADRAGAKVTVNIVIPAAGEGSRFVKAGYSVPKPFIDVLGKPMIHHVLNNVAVPGARATALLRRSHIAARPVERVALGALGVDIVPVEAATEGTACTVLLAREQFDNGTPLLIANSDQLVDFSCEAFIADAMARGLDGSILVFRDKARDPKWSFAKLDDAGLVAQVAEKLPISDLATVGIYFFRRGSDFVRAALDMIVRNERVNNEFYTCPVYNHMIRLGLKIGVYEIAETAMHGLGTPEDLDRYIGS